jgi:predicted DNA-binding protein (MmcQ/YjbR family)
MAKKKAVATKSPQPKSFSGALRGRSRQVKDIAQALRDLVHEELPDAQESFYGGQRPMAMYRTIAEVCWIQPLKERCNIYFMRGTELTDVDQVLEGTSDRFRYAKIGSLDDIEQLPLRDWLQESVALNDAATNDGMKFEDVLKRLQTICLALPDTKETLTWGKPHFRVGEKIFCGCSEDQGGPRIGLKMEANESELMMKLPGIEKAPYSRKGDGWVAIDPGLFEDWEEIERSIVGSYRLIAPRRTVAALDSREHETNPSRRRRSANRGK